MNDGHYTLSWNMTRAATCKPSYIHRQSPQRKVRKIVFLREFYDVLVQVGARSGMKMRGMRNACPLMMSVVLRGNIKGGWIAATELYFDFQNGGSISLIPPVSQSY